MAHDAPTAAGHDASDAHDAHTASEANEALLAAAVALADKRAAVLTGAGISTESGIPDYRGPATRAKARKPMRFAQFIAGDDARKRYWARATVGWPRIRDAAPNAGHQALVDAAPSGAVAGLITQNVDGLHEKAGSTGVVELHGALRDVVCLACPATEARESVHRRLLAANPGFGDVSAGHAPDGDVDLDDDTVAAFTPVACASCGGALKPRVVFFGENVPTDVVAAAWRVFDAANALVVVGSSLEVYSGRRFVEEAARRTMPIVIVNATSTRADDLATVVLRGAAGVLLPALWKRAP